MCKPGRNSLFLILILLLCIASNCNEPQATKPKDPITLYNYLGDVKDYCVFKPGTYWVYRNDQTGEIDSHWVSSCNVYMVTQKGTEDYSKHITLMQELFDMAVNSNFVDGLGNKNYWEFYTTGANVDSYPEPHLGFVAECRKVWNVGSTSKFVYRKPYFNTSNYPAYQTGVYSNYNVSSCDYDSVRVFRVEYDGVFQESKAPVGTGNSNYYFAKNNGIIKVEIEGFKILDGHPFNQTWSLIRKKIIQ